MSTKKPNILRPKKECITVFPSIPNWRSRIFWERRNAKFSSGYGSGHKYLLQNQFPFRLLTSEDETNSTENSSRKVGYIQRENKDLHDWSEIEGLEEREIGRLRETRSENAVLHHREIGRRLQNDVVSVSVHLLLVLLLHTSLCCSLVENAIPISVNCQEKQQEWEEEEELMVNGFEESQGRRTKRRRCRFRVSFLLLVSISYMGASCETKNIGEKRN